MGEAPKTEKNNTNQQTIAITIGWDSWLHFLWAMGHGESWVVGHVSWLRLFALKRHAAKERVVQFLDANRTIPSGNTAELQTWYGNIVNCGRNPWTVWFKGYIPNWAKQMTSPVHEVTCPSLKQKIAPPFFFAGVAAWWNRRTTFRWSRWIRQPF